MAVEDYIDLIVPPPEYEGERYRIVDVIRETEKAYHIRAERDRDHDIVFWVPKSQCDISGDEKKGTWVTIDGWFAENHLNVEILDI